MDHDLSPPWTSLSIAKAIKTRLFAQPLPQWTTEEKKAYLIVNNGLTSKEQSWSLMHARAPNWSLSPLQDQTIVR